MRNDWFFIFLLVVVAYVTINAQSNLTATNNTITNVTGQNGTGNGTLDDDDDEEVEPHKDLRCYSCRQNVTVACGDPFDRNDPNVFTATCPNHTLCYVGFLVDFFRNVLDSSRGCIYDADGPREYKYFHFYCDFDLCNRSTRALKFEPLVLLAIFFLRSTTNIPLIF